MKKFIFLFTALIAVSACFLCACYDFVVGNTYTKVYGIQMTVEYDGLTVKATDGVYNLNAGSTYAVEVSLIQGGGSTPSGIEGDCITFDYGGTVNITYVGDNGGSVIYNMSATAAGTSIVTAYMGTYSCSATIDWQQAEIYSAVSAATPEDVTR